ncbi:MAG: hypothetical protein QG635_2347 [Bacteroidota bacterium]|nr:hypothetical protein [Bacteroidota bacterium]
MFDGKTKEAAELIEQNGFRLLQVLIAHILEYESLELIHKEPFDRILIAQTIVNKMTIITR